MIWLKIKRLDKELPLPKYESKGAAGIDIYSAEFKDIPPRTCLLIKTGIAFEITPGYMGVIKSRSGIAVKKNTHVRAGVVDEDYRGEVKVLLCNDGNKVVKLNKGDRIAQVLIVPVTRCTVQESDELAETDRQEGGWGSTGGYNFYLQEEDDG
jgi:dUTP pyrophosphatase